MTNFMNQYEEALNIPPLELPEISLLKENQSPEVNSEEEGEGEIEPLLLPTYDLTTTKNK